MKFLIMTLLVFGCAQAFAAAKDFSTCKWVVTVENAQTSPRQVVDLLKEFADVTSIVPMRKHTLIFATYSRPGDQRAARAAVKYLKSLDGVDLECTPDREPKS